MTSPRNTSWSYRPRTLLTTGFLGSSQMSWNSGASTYSLSSFGGLRFCRGWRDFLHGCLGCFFSVVGGWSLVSLSGWGGVLRFCWDERVGGDGWGGLFVGCCCWFCMLPALIFGELCFFLESQGCCGGCQVDSIDAQEAGKEQIVVFNGIRPKTSSSHLLFFFGSLPSPGC